MPVDKNWSLKNKWKFGVIGGKGTAAECYGTASEFNIDGLERDSDEDARTGTAGMTHHGGEFGAITANITLTAITKSVRMALLESVCSNVTINLTAIFENIRDNCETEVYTAQMRGIINKYPIGWQLSNEAAENEIIMGVNYFKEIFLDDTFTYDPDEIIWQVNDTNYWADIKTGLGV